MYENIRQKNTQSVNENFVSKLNINQVLQKIFQFTNGNNGGIIFSINVKILTSPRNCKKKVFFTSNDQQKK